MFLKKLFSFSSKNEVLVYENKLYKMYLIEQNNKKGTKFVMTNDIQQYELLKKIRHDNILHPQKINLKNKSLTTSYLIPFEIVYKQSTEDFNKFLFLCIAKALDFLHTNCSISHNNIFSTSLFFNEDCKIVLGGFEKAHKTTNFDSDNMQFSNLLYKYTGINCSLTEFIKKNGFTDNLFYDNDVFFFGFDAHPVESKKDFIRLLKTKQNQLIEIYKKRIVKYFLQDLFKEYDKDYKEEVLNFIFYLDFEDYTEIIEDLFKVLDSNVRFYLFKNSNKYIEKVNSLDGAIESLLLGFKCKNQNLRSETFNFCTDNHSKLSENSQILLLDTAYEFIGDDKGMEEVLIYLDTTKPVFTKSDVIYKILKNYLINSNKKEMTIDVIGTFYGTFNKYKVSTELLPILCTSLANENLQYKTFPLIDMILKDLKDHKEQIISREWSFEAFKDFFSRKGKDVKNNKRNYKEIQKNKETHINSKITNTPVIISSPEKQTEDEWDDDW